MIPVVDATSGKDEAGGGIAATRELVHDRIVEWLRREGGLSVDRIDFDASLLEVGVTSLGAATIGGELEQLTGKILNPDVLFELETVNDLAEYLDRAPLRAKKADAVAAVEVATPVEGGAGDGERGTSGLLAHYRQLNRRVCGLKEKGMYFFEPEITRHDGAWVVVGGKRMLMMGSYEYLGLLGHPHLAAAAQIALGEFGTGHHGARLLTGTTSVHKTLEARLARFMNAEDAIVFSSGYVTNLATVSTLVGRGDCIVGDQWNHASIVDGCRLSGADLIEFRHNDIDSLVECLDRTDGRRTLVIVDAVFSMDGDIVDLPAVVEQCRKYQAILMVDEAHSLGVLGATGRGIQEHFGLGPYDIDVKMGTLSKTFAGSGGFVAGREEIITFLRHHARGYIFSGALPAGQASVAIAALEVLDREPQLLESLWNNVKRYQSGLVSLGFDTGHTVTPIVPIMTRNAETTLEMTRRCREEGLLVVPVCYPAVPADAPRLRTCVSAVQTSDEIDFALSVLAKVGREVGLIQ
jgi:glycine C-acetyltransferase